MSAFAEPLAQARVAAKILFHDVEELDEFVIAHEQDLLSALDRVERLATDMEAALREVASLATATRIGWEAGLPRDVVTALRRIAVLSAREEGTA